MTEIVPEIPCQDFWPHGAPREKLYAYRVMIEAGQISKPQVLINQATGAMIMTYLSKIPHDWIRQEMGRISREGQQERIG